MSINVDCYLTFKKDTKKSKDTHVTCGVVLVHEEEEVFTHFESFDHGKYMAGMFWVLVKAMEFLHLRTLEGVNLFVKIHGRNKNFFTVFTKILKGYNLVKGVDVKSHSFILQQAFTRRDYHKPASYEVMINMVDVLLKVNAKQPFELTLGMDANSLKAQRTYFETITHHNDYRTEQLAGNVVPFPSPYENKNLIG
jgi:hypothetical protein